MGASYGEQKERLVRHLAVLHQLKPDSPWLSVNAIPNGEMQIFRELVHDSLAQHHGTFVRLTPEGRDLGDKLSPPPEVYVDDQDPNLRLWMVRGQVEVAVLATSSQQALVCMDKRMRAGAQPEPITWLEPQHITRHEQIPHGWHDRVPFSEMKGVMLPCRDWLIP